MSLIHAILIFLCFISNFYGFSVFNENDSVIELNANNFNNNIYSKSHICLVNFYLHWCPHCITYSKVWKEFANDIKDWHSVVKVYAIDCANKSSEANCRRHGITRFPRIRLFKTFANTADLGQTFETRDTVQQLKTQFIDWLLTSHQHLRHDINLYPISIVSKNELFNALPLNLHKYNLIFLVNNPTHLAVEIILDFSQHSDAVNIITVNDRSGRLRSQLFSHSVNLPALINAHTNHSLQLIASAHSTNEELLRKEFGLKIKELLNISEIQININETNNREKNITTNSLIISIRNELPLSLSDLYNTLRQFLHSEVTRYEKLNSNQLKILKTYFSIIYKYFPFDNENVRRFFKRMKHWFSNKTDEIKSETLIAAMKISDGYLPPMVQWRHCSGSKPNFRGYSCGLWSLFHVLTVREYTMNKKNKTQNTHEVLPLMRDFIINFFSCEDCAKHFEKTSRRLTSYLDTDESSVLWLWRVHNQVNQRTKGSLSEDPYFPKVQYPTHQMCGQCFQNNNEFNETNVLKYLLETYDPKNLTKSAAYYAEQKVLAKNSDTKLEV
ncbi:sulfhydryl oxidase 2-like [Oppia nitens]|uniref:sulfhydryl oxidase 2-like n=1 Tax=Oppia nitens TaxID=1686743 RepID=UPI0023D9D312|nr:sulfhydryl oxidase 2-like [Oppia nitens]